MASRSKSTGYSAKVPRPERIELVRRLIISGVPDWQIRRMLVEGITLDDGRVARVNRSTACKDLQAIGIEYAELHDDPLVRERVVGAAAERLVRIADKAEAAGNFHAAIRANVAIVDVVGRRWPRWGRGADDGVRDVTSAGGASRGAYEGMSDDELQRELAAKRSRLGNLTLVEGGKG